jgi:hypothetical protein
MWNILKPEIMKTLLRIWISIVILIVPGLSLAAVPNCDEPTSMLKSSSPFRGIQVKGNIKVVVVSDNIDGFRVSQENEDAEYVEPRIANRSLYLVRERNRNEEPVVVYVSCKSLKAIETYDGAQVINNQTVRSKNIYFYVHDSGSIDFMVSAERIAANVGKNGLITIRGHFDETSVQVKGKGKVMLKNHDMSSSAREVVSSELTLEE